MRDLDSLKEELSYLRLWLGLVVATEISLVGWVATAGESATPRLFVLAIIGIMAAGFGLLLLHRLIERRIQAIRRL
jgi:hypothetical protein